MLSFAIQRTSHITRTQRDDCLSQFLWWDNSQDCLEIIREQKTGEQRFAPFFFLKSSITIPCFQCCNSPFPCFILQDWNGGKGSGGSEAEGQGRYGSLLNAGQGECYHHPGQGHTQVFVDSLIPNPVIAELALRTTWL